MSSGVQTELAGGFLRDKEKHPKVAAYDAVKDEIPVISLSGIDDVGGKRGEICRQIVEACKNWGIFQVVDHGVNTNLVADMSRLASDFFALTLEEKMRFDMSVGKRGGFMVSSHGQQDGVQDWKEVVAYFCYPVGNRDYSRWPDKPKGWVKVTEDYSERLMGLACKLLEVLSEAMGLEKEALANACTDMDHKIFVNYYLKCPKPDLTLGKRHTDTGTITVLLQDEVGCLQTTRDNGKTWVTVQSVEGAFVVNLGDHIHYLSNGTFKSADHRAVVNSNSSRLSIAAMLFPGPEATVYPLKVREGEKAIMEESISFGEMYKGKNGETSRADLPQEGGQRRI